MFYHEATKAFTLNDLKFGNLKMIKKPNIKRILEENHILNYKFLAEQLHARYLIWNRM